MGSENTQLFKFDIKKNPIFVYVAENLQSCLGIEKPLEILEILNIYKYCNMFFTSFWCFQPGGSTKTCVEYGMR